MKEILLIFILLSPILWSVKEYFDRKDRPNPTFFETSILTEIGTFLFFAYLGVAITVLYHLS